MANVTAVTPERNPARVRTTRAAKGRLLGGVCAGLPDIWGIGTNGLRLAFLVTALLGGAGVIVYLACWLIIPAAEDAITEEPSGIALLAWATGGLVVVILLAVMSALATLFGLGWAVLALGILLVAGSCALRGRIPPAAVLPMLAALALPALAVSLTGARMPLRSSAYTVRPPDAAAVSATVFHSGVGDLMVDLRHTRLPRSGAIPLRIDAGVRRTIVALPAGQCVHVRVIYHVRPFVAQLAALVSGDQFAPFDGVVLFGRDYAGGTQTGPRGVATAAGPARGPTLDVDFTSLGGSLYVRDYPDDVSPSASPYWPGTRVSIEQRPSLVGEPPKAAREMLQHWRQRRRRDLAARAWIARRIGGPCAH